MSPDRTLPARLLRGLAVMMPAVVALQLAGAAVGAEPNHTVTTAPVQLAPGHPVRIAQSALLSAEAVVTADAVQLTFRRVSDKSVVGGTEVTATVDGKNQPLTTGPGNSAELALAEVQDGAHDLDLVVPHDGIREVLSARVAVAAPSSAGSLLGDHKQIAWWILNIIIILIAASVLSRRKG